MEAYIISPEKLSCYSFTHATPSQVTSVDGASMHHFPHFTERGETEAQ